MRILITNDDGINAPGLETLEAIATEVAGPGGEVWTVAPAFEQSGVAHCISYTRPMMIAKLEPRRYAAEGSPADCVLAGLYDVLQGARPDLVLSGVNAGQNLGDIVNCSGTAAGAREGVLQGAIGIAMSQSMDYEVSHKPDWANARRYGAEVVSAILAAHDGDDVFYNVNFPFCTTEEVVGLTAVAHQRFSRSPIRYYPSDNEGQFFMAIPETPQPLDPAADFEVLR